MNYSSIVHSTCLILLFCGCSVSYDHDELKAIYGSAPIYDGLLLVNTQPTAASGIGFHSSAPWGLGLTVTGVNALSSLKVFNIVAESGSKKISVEGYENFSMNETGSWGQAYTRCFIPFPDDSSNIVNVSFSIQAEGLAKKDYHFRLVIEKRTGVTKFNPLTA